jgi:hypothetical protein
MEGAKTTCAQAGDLVNDLRSPLAAIRAGAELLLRPDLSPQQIHRLARDVLFAAGRIEEILSDVTPLCVPAPHFVRPAGDRKRRRDRQSGGFK